MHFNEKLARSSALRNPNLLQKLTQHVGFEKGDEYASGVWEPGFEVDTKWLEAEQEKERSRREKERETVEFVAPRKEEVKEERREAPRERREVPKDRRDDAGAMPESRGERLAREATEAVKGRRRENEDDRERRRRRSRSREGEERRRDYGYRDRR